MEGGRKEREGSERRKGCEGGMKKGRREGGKKEIYLQKQSPPKLSKFF